MPDDDRHGVRRAPRTEASVAITDAIVTAAAELLSAHGLEGLTTNRIAKRAGVSVGSVYRYFADKQAIVAEIGRRQRAFNAKAMDDIVRAGGPLPELVRKALEHFAMLHQPQKFQLRRMLALDIPHRWMEPDAEQAWRNAEDTIAAAIKTGVPTISNEEAKRRAFMVLHACEGVLRDAAIRKETGDREALVDELFTFVLPYMARPPG